MNTTQTPTQTPTQTLPTMTEQPPTYLVLPTSQTTFMNMFFVLMVYIIYLLVIAYISLYNTVNVPNIRMFIDFLTDNNEPIDNLSKSIKKIIDENKETFTNKKETSPPTTLQKTKQLFSKTIQQIKQTFLILINKLIVRTFVSGNKIKTSYKINL